MNAVRLCNVIGSSGSVVPLFSSRSRAGARYGHRSASEPMVSHPPRRWTRFWLAACRRHRESSCCLQSENPCASLTWPDFLFTRPEMAAEVAYMGLRPGEKLTEELIFETERKVGMVGCLTLSKRQSSVHWT